MNSTPQSEIIRMICGHFWYFSTKVTFQTCWLHLWIWPFKTLWTLVGQKNCQQDYQLTQYPCLAVAPVPHFPDWRGMFAQYPHCRRKCDHGIVTFLSGGKIDNFRPLCCSIRRFKRSFSSFQSVIQNYIGKSHCWHLFEVSPFFKGYDPSSFDIVAIAIVIIPQDAKKTWRRLSFKRNHW